MPDNKLERRQRDWQSKTRRRVTRGAITLTGIAALAVAAAAPALAASGGPSHHQARRPSAALAAAHSTTRHLTGRDEGTFTLNLVTGEAIGHASGYISPLGADTAHDDLTFTFTSASTFSYTGARTFALRNGELFAAITGSGTLTSPSTAESTEHDTITGGTGRFAEASGTLKETIRSVVVKVTATSQTALITIALKGQISY